jgi:hypothetical protein
MKQINLEEIYPAFKIHRLTKKRWASNISDEQYRDSLEFYLEEAVYDDVDETFEPYYRRAVNFHGECLGFTKLREAVCKNPLTTSPLTQEATIPEEIKRACEAYLNLKIFTCKTQEELLNKNKKEYSLWFKPPIPKTCLDILIRRLCERFNSHSFESHVTLLGGLKGDKKGLIKSTQELAKQIKPFPITLGNWSYSQEYFKKLFAEIPLSNDLKDARLEAERLFQVQQMAYSPHLSVMYGPRDDFNQEDFIWKYLGRQVGLGFTATSISLYDTTHAPEEWQEVASFDLG